MTKKVDDKKDLGAYTTKPYIPTHTGNSVYFKFKLGDSVMSKSGFKGVVTTRSENGEGAIFYELDNGRDCRTYHEGMVYNQPQPPICPPYEPKPGRSE